MIKVYNKIIFLVWVSVCNLTFGVVQDSYRELGLCGCIPIFIEDGQNPDEIHSRQEYMKTAQSFRDSKLLLLMGAVSIVGGIAATLSVDPKLGKPLCACGILSGGCEIVCGVILSIYTLKSNQAAMEIFTREVEDKEIGTISGIRTWKRADSF